jgi:hypothetical protein
MRMRFITVVLPLLLACNPSEPAKKEEPAKSAAKTSPTVTPTQPSTPSTEVAKSPPNLPKPVTPTNEWWCVCYQSTGDAGPQPATACRAHEDQCHALEQRIAKGSRALVAGSLTHNCRKLSGEHPGDSTGGRERWQPSKLEGAWSSEGACLLEGEAAPVAAEPGEPIETGEPEDPFMLMASEAIGDLAIAMSASEVKAAFGDPSETSEIQVEEAHGDFVQAWNYAGTGLSLVMRSFTQDGEQMIASVTITMPSQLQTRRGIAIGSSWEDVQKAYGDVADKDIDTSDHSSFVAGSIYGGVIFSFEDDKVTSIFLGAGAE